VTYKIIVQPRARKAYLALDRTVRKRIGAAIDALATDPRPPGAKALVGMSGVLRVRVGDYRILYDVRDDELVILVIDVGHRREIYR
jgi:mRNA interferase RelE/StbE